MSFLQHYWHVVLIGVILFFITIGFVVKFIIPARRIGRELATAIDKLKTIKAEGDRQTTDLSRVSDEIMLGEKLAHCWSEFTETLHGQSGISHLGQESVVRYRATALAESFFTDQALVETPLKTEFYKHLPGILTGIGIIGTFSGLILGLIDFQVTTNADEVRNSLAGLIQNVGHAFMVSASAIALAMIATWVEKSLVTKRYRQVEELCVLIDSLFDAGAGEEYLARLVMASETQATQAAQIKDALVADLKEILAEMTKQQIAASATHNQQLSESMAKTFSESLREPITRISEAVERVSGNQGDAVNRMLTDVLSSFSSQMKDMFGGQLTGMNEVLLKTSESIQMAAGKFDQLAANMQSAGQGAVEQMAQRMESMIGAMESRQDAMNGRMAEFVEQIRQSVDSSQTESAEKMRSMMADLGNQMASAVAQLDQQSKTAALGHEQQVGKMEEQLDRFLKMTEVIVTRYQRETGEQMQSSLTELGSKASSMIEALKDQGAQAATAHAERQVKFGEQTEAVLGRLAGEVEQLAGVVQTASKAMESSVGSLANVTRDTVDRMNAGAGTLNSAANSLTVGLDDMRLAVTGISGTSEKLSNASGSMVEAARSVGNVMDQYRATRDSFAGIVENLRVLIETAKKDASMTSEIVGRLSSATEKLADAQETTEGYLEGISSVLAEAHGTFAENIQKTLHTGNAQFHKELATAVGHLKGAIQDLGDTLDVVAVKG